VVVHYEKRAIDSIRASVYIMSVTKASDGFGTNTNSFDAFEFY
jgi:hypothetical protein